MSKVTKPTPKAKYTATQQNNMAIIVDELKKRGITNQFSHAAILAVIGKETGFNPAKEEVSYARTDNSRIRQIFSKTKLLTDPQLNLLKSDMVNFFDFVYTGVAGNGPKDGYKYRGRGYNQITGKANYANLGKVLKLDLVNRPDLLNDPVVAAKAAAIFFEQGFKSLKSKNKTKAANINDFKNDKDSLAAFYHINAGTGKSQAVIDADVTGGYAKAKAAIADLYEYASNNTGTVATGGLLFFCSQLSQFIS